MTHQAGGRGWRSGVAGGTGVPPVPPRFATSSWRVANPPSPVRIREGPLSPSSHRTAQTRPTGQTVPTVLSGAFAFHVRPRTFAPFAALAKPLLPMTTARAGRQLPADQEGIMRRMLIAAAALVALDGAARAQLPPPDSLPLWSLPVAAAPNLSPLYPIYSAPPAFGPYPPLPAAGLVRTSRYGDPDAADVPTVLPVTP